MNLSFEHDISRGEVGEVIFKNDYLDFLKIKYDDVTKNKDYQVVGTDFLVMGIGKVEIKSTYKDDKQLIIEEFTDYQPDLGIEKRGWFYTSSASLIAFVSTSSRTIILMPFTDDLKVHYSRISERHKLIMNKPTESKFGGKWQSAYRRIPLDELKEYVSWYKKNSTEKQQIKVDLDAPQMPMFSVDFYRENGWKLPENWKIIQNKK